MSDRASSDVPPPERSGETLWVVDVTAPLAPGRVRWVAGEAAARLQLPAEKLVALLENRIGPVTKPLPKASADRVAEVLDLAGAEVAIRAAGSADGGHASVEGREPSEPAAGGAASESASEDASAPEEPVPADGPQSEPASEPDPDPASDTAPDSAPRSTAAPPTTRATQHPTDGAARAARDADTDAPASTASDAETHVEVDTGDASVDVGAREEPRGRQEIADPQETPRTTTDDRPTEASAAGDEVGPGTPRRERAEAASPPPVGRPGTTARDAGARDDPWKSLDDDEDEAMLGAWTHRAASAPSDAAAKAASAGSSSQSAGLGAAARATRRPAPPAPAATGSPGGGPTSSVVPPFDPSESPDVMIDRTADADGTDDEDEDEGWAYGLRDPFEEAERQERAMRRWALAFALLVALGIFLVLQWAYSRPGLGDRTPPGYDVGLTAYRDGAFVSAARAWAPRAEAGDVDAMFMLGWMAEYGQGRPWSNREAAGWYGQAAQRGHAPSQLRLADLYARGLGVAFDPDVAARWYLAAAEGGLPRAQREAALAMARDGRHAEAAAWLDRAAAHDPDAAAWLALVDAARTLNPRSE
ncbi:MAG: hypothetical protein U5J97_03880 [Trueperaceae bacterium]|nr:hypothetical protein [Trueperaceae bacterium]